MWKLSEQFNEKLIFLFRKQNLEKSDIEKQLRGEIIKLLENSDNMMDFDVNNKSWGLEFIKENKLNNRTIASYHNYKETPDLEELKKIYKNMEQYQPEIFKVSTFCKTPEDGLILLNLLLLLKKEGKEFIILGMGDEGKIVRIFGALWGNEINFAPIKEDEKSAPGQMTRKKLEEIFERIK